jgi:hypothetical protein
MSTGGSRSDEIAVLYDTYAPAVERKVTALVPAAPRADVHDACSFAWMQLLTHPGVDLAPPPIRWLARTALRETWRLGRRGLAARHDPTRSLETVPDSSEDLIALVEHRERLAQLKQLPRRRRRLLWLQGLGLSREELMRLTGDTQLTIDRQLRKAREGVRRLEAEASLRATSTRS